MSRTIPPHVWLVVLLCLARCNAFGGGETAEPPVVTPADVPTDNPLSDLPPGLSPAGITDSSALATAHAKALSNTSFTVRSTRTLTAANGTQLVDTTSVQRVRSDHRRWRAKIVYNGTEGWGFGPPIERRASWFNGSHIFFQLQGPNGTAYRVLSGGLTPTNRQQLRSYYLQAEVTTVTAVNGTIRLHATIVPPDEQPTWPPNVNITERTITLMMTETGRVTQYRIEYTGRVATAPATVVTGMHTVRFTTLGETTVDRPEWVPTARRAIAPARNASTTAQ
jgi:hypothetical protein